MRIFRTLLKAICAFALLGSGARAAPLAPNGPWKVDYDEAQCVASREYGTSDKPLILALKPSPLGQVMRILVIRKGMANAEQFGASLRFGSGPSKKIHLLYYGDGKTKLRVASVNLPMAEFRQNVGASSMTIESIPVSAQFSLSHIAGVVAELDKCLADLQEYWNVSAAADAEQAPKPATPLSKYFSARDYPSVAISQRFEGSVVMSLLIDETGRIADCSVEETSKVPVLDTISCYIVRNRAVFRPAVGPDGKPRKGATVQRVVWRIEG